MLEGEDIKRDDGGRWRLRVTDADQVCVHHTPITGCVTSACACKCIHDNNNIIIIVCNIVVSAGMTQKQKQKSKTGFIHFFLYVTHSSVLRGFRVTKDPLDLNIIIMCIHK